MATLEQLESRKRELEARLADGDLKAEALLDQLDRAVAARTLEIQRSQAKLAVRKNAVASGVSTGDARRLKPKASPETMAKRRAKRPLNRF